MHFDHSNATPMSPDAICIPKERERKKKRERPHFVPLGPRDLFPPKGWMASNSFKSGTTTGLDWACEKLHLQWALHSVNTGGYKSATELF